MILLHAKHEQIVNPELFLKFVCENAVFLANGIEGIFVLSNVFLKSGCESAVFSGRYSEGTSTDNYEPNVNPEFFLKFVCESAVFFGYRSEGAKKVIIFLRNFFKLVIRLQV